MRLLSFDFIRLFIHSFIRLFIESIYYDMTYESVSVRGRIRLSGTASSFVQLIPS